MDQVYDGHQSQADVGANAAGDVQPQGSNMDRCQYILLPVLVKPNAVLCRTGFLSLPHFHLIMFDFVLLSLTDAQQKVEMVEHRVANTM